jgi:hypothetical protein
MLLGFTDMQRVIRQLALTCYRLEES